jgi:predicted nucleotidyltransferase
MDALIDLIDENRTELAELCRRYGVVRLYLFGSAATTGRFVNASNDLDFTVELADRQPTGAYADRYIGLAEDLERLFGRKVDLITEESVRNPFFRREVDATRQLIYGQPREEAAV